jgi:hypothetical protein
MGAYGYSIEQTLIVDVEPDATVRRAMNEINAGQFTYTSPFKLSEAIFSINRHAISSVT